MSGYPMEPIRENKEFKGAVRNVKNCEKGPKGHEGKFSRETTVLKDFFLRL